MHQVRESPRGSSLTRSNVSALAPRAIRYVPANTEACRLVAYHSRHVLQHTWERLEQVVTSSCAEQKYRVTFFRYIFNPKFPRVTLVEQCGLYNYISVRLNQKLVYLFFYITQPVPPKTHTFSGHCLHGVEGELLNHVYCIQNII